MSKQLRSIDDGEVIYDTSKKFAIAFDGYDLVKVASGQLLFTSVGGMKRLIIGDVTTDSCKLRLGWKWVSVHVVKNTRQRSWYNVNFSRNLFDRES